MKKFKWNGLVRLTLDSVLITVLMTQLFYYITWYMVHKGFGSSFEQNNSSLYVYFATMILLLFAFYRVFIIYNEPTRIEYCSNHLVSSCKEKFSFIFHSKTFWTYLGALMGIYLIFPLKWTFTGFANVIQIENAFVDKLVSLVILFMFFAMMLTLAFFAAFRHWADKKNDHMYSDSDYDRAVNPLGPIFAVGYAMVLIVFGFAFR